MKIIKTIFLIIFTSNSAMISFSDEMPQKLIQIDKTDAISMALNNMEDIRISSIETDAAVHEYREAKTAFYPQISGSASWHNNNRYPVNPRYPSGRFSDYEINVGASLSQVICSFGRISSAIEAARKSLEISGINENITKEEVIYNTKVAYYSAILAQNILEIAESSYDNSLENKEILEDRSSTGRVSKKDNIKILADIASRTPFVSEARSDLMSAENTLKRLMGLDDNTGIEIKEIPEVSFEQMSFPSLAGYLLEKEPTLKMLEQNISLQDSLVKKEKAEYYPSIAAYATWDYTGESDHRKDWYIGDADLFDQFGTVGIKVDVPIFDCGKTMERIKKTEKDREKAAVEYEKTVKDLSLELNNAISDYNEYINTLKANSEAVELAERSFMLFQDLFKTGQVTLLELNDAELRLTNEKISKETTIFNLNTTFAKIERLTLIGESHE